MFDDNKGFFEVNKIIIIVFLMGIIIGYGIGYAVVYHNNIRSSDERINFVEERMMSMENFLPVFSSNSITNITLFNARDYYFRYHDVSRYMLRLELDNICGVCE